MENEIYAPVAGVVTEIKVKQGDQLNADDVLIVIGGNPGNPVVANPGPAPVAEVAANPAPAVATAGSEVRAPMPGLVLRLEVREGDSVELNGLLMVMEAMKMENEIFAPVAGTVKQILVKQGDQLMADDLLMVIG